MFSFRTSIVVSLFIIPLFSIHAQADPQADYEQCAIAAVQQRNASSVSDVISVCQSQRNALQASLNPSARDATLAEIDAITEKGIRLFAQQR